MSVQSSSIRDLRIDRSQARSSRAGGWIFVIVLLLAAAGGGTWWWKTRPAALAVQTAEIREVAPTGKSSDRTVLNGSGYVVARREATVSSKVTGKVAEVMVEEGMKVKKDQVLARLDDVNVRASLALADAQLSAARVALEETRVRIKEAERELLRESGLISKKVSTQADYDRAEASAMALRAKLREQQANVEVAERTVDSWKQQLEDTIIRAAFNGIVTSKNAQPGEMISPMSAGGGFTRTGICTIVDMESLEIEVDVNESYINRVKTGQAVEAALDAYPEWKIPCKVIAIIPTADRQKSTVRVRVGFDKLDPKILPEMSVKVAFHETGTPTSTESQPQKTAYLVPAKAIVRQDGRDVMYVVHNGRAERRTVNVASRSENEVVLGSGASPGEKVVLEPQNTLADGAAVKEVAKK